MNHKLLSLALVLGDVFIFYISIPIALFIRHLKLVDIDFINLHILYFTPIILIWVLVFFIAGLYSNLIILFRQKNIETLVLAQIINIIIALLIFFVILDSNISPRFTMLIYLVVSLVLLYFWRIKIFPRYFAPKSIELITSHISPAARNIVNHLKDNLFFKIQLSKQKMPAQRKNNSISLELVDDLNGVDYEYLNTLMKANKNFIYVSELLELLGKLDISHTNNSLLTHKITLSAKEEKYLYRFLKRLFDVLLAFLALPFALLISIFVALAIYIESGLPIIYRSKRRGYKGKDFVLYKFRTMTGTDSGSEAKNSKLKVTKIGKFLRATRLDELPQLLNIIKGDMSFVGPRPEISEIADEYEEKIPLYFMRHFAKPGLTGWAQIAYSGDPHHKIDVEATLGKLEYDLYYISKKSIVFDLQIIVQTILIVLKLRGK